MVNHTTTNEMVNGSPNLSLAPGVKNDVEMLDQIKQLLLENNNLKEAMKQKNQEMKERLEELLKREKQRGQRQSEKETSSCPACDTAQENLKQLNMHLLRLQTEKADLLAIISELQVKLSSCSSEDSFVEIRIAEKENRSGQIEDNPENSEKNPEFISYRRTKSSDEDRDDLESEELAVSKLLQSLREETQKVEKLEKALLAVNERVAKLEKKAADISDKETQTEPEPELTKECESVQIQLSNEVDTLKQKVKSLNKELKETNEKLTEAEQFKNKLQDKCISLDKKLLDNEVDLEEKQKLIYSVQKLELQVESMQSEMKMEQSKTQAEKTLLSNLQESYGKLKRECEELTRFEADSVSKVQFNDLVQKLDVCETALAKKQFQIDELNKLVDKHKEEAETIGLLKAQIEIYCSDFHAEREARQNIHQEKEQLAIQLSYMIQENEKLKEQIKNRQSIQQLQQRHGSTSESQNLVPRGADHLEQAPLQMFACPKCNLTVPDMDTLQIHVMDCIT